MNSASNRLTTWLKVLVFGALACGLVACQTTTFMRGNMPTDYQISQVEIGKTTMAELTDALGTPTVKSTADSNFWFYTAQTLRDDALGGRELLGQTVLIVQFGDFQRVASIRKVQVDPAGIIQPTPQTTNITLRERTIIEQAIGALFPS